MDLMVIGYVLAMVMILQLILLCSSVARMSICTLLIDEHEKLTALEKLT